MAHNQLSMLNEAYALGCEMTIMNPINDSSIRVMLEKPIEYNAVKIEAGTPIQNLDDF